MNLIVISFYTVPALYVLRKSKKEIFVIIFLLFLPILFFTYGSYQKKEFLNSELKKNPYTVRIIGSNISINRFYDNLETEKVINELISISSPDKEKEIFFIWPEGIIPNTYQDELDLYNDIIGKYFNKNHLIGLGITSREISNDDYKYYNSFSILDNNLNLIDHYNKINLVPFGEFLPFENILNKIGLRLITNKIESFSKEKIEKF